MVGVALDHIRDVCVCVCAYSLVRLTQGGGRGNSVAE